jgi:hypothetical protein
MPGAGGLDAARRVAWWWMSAIVERNQRCGAATALSSDAMIKRDLMRHSPLWGHKPR